jgi:hypothetical protein
VGSASLFLRYIDGDHYSVTTGPVPQQMEGRDALWRALAEDVDASAALGPSWCKMQCYECYREACCGLTCCWWARCLCASTCMECNLGQYAAVKAELQVPARASAPAPTPVRPRALPSRSPLARSPWQSAVGKHQAAFNEQGVVLEVLIG